MLGLALPQPLCQGKAEAELESQMSKRNADPKYSMR